MHNAPLHWKRTFADQQRSARVLVAAGLVLCVLFAAAGLLLHAPRWSARVDIGNEGEFRAEGETETFTHFVDFHGREVWNGRSIRWSKAYSALTFPAAMRLHPLALEIVACGCRSNNNQGNNNGETVPVDLVLNNTPLATLPTDNTWRRYMVLVPPGLSHPDNSLMVTLRSPTWNDGERVLGVALDSITVREAAPRPLAAPVSVAVLLVGMAGVVWWCRSLAGGVLLVLLLLLLGGGWLCVHLLYQPQVLPAPILGTTLVVGMLWLWWNSIRSAPPASASRTLVPLSAIIALWLVLSPQVLGTWLVDDAFISFRYAHNLLQGYGLVFNPGERVEGYTNFLWTMITAGILALGGGPVVAAAALTLLLAFVAVGLTIALARVVVPPAWVWVAPVLLALSSPFLLYTSRGSGMETALFTVLVLATLLALLAHRWRVAGVLAALLLLTRPDGAVLAGAGGVYALWWGWRSRRTLPDTSNTLVALVRPALHYGGTAALLYVPYFLWRWSYYGYLLPNTFYAKVGGTRTQFARGVGYVLAFAGDELLLLGALVAVVVGVWAWQGRYERWGNVGLIAGVCALVTLYIVAVGGDWMPAFRFFVPIVPLLCVLVGWGAAGVAQRVPRSVPLVLVGLALLVLVVVGLLPGMVRDTSHNPDTAVGRHDRLTRRHREVGRWINQHMPPDTLLVEDWAGAMPYYANRPTIDILGLNDEYIAHLPPGSVSINLAGHEKTDPDYVMQRRPHLISWFTVPYLDNHPIFESSYHLEEVRGPEGNTLRLFVRNDMTLPGGRVVE